MKRYFFLLVIAFFFYACPAEDETSLNVCETIPNSCICPRNYDPVCGCDNITYSNSCEAECDNIFDYVPGECP